MIVKYHDCNASTEHEEIPLWDAMARIHPLAVVHWDRDGLQFPGRPTLIQH